MGKHPVPRSLLWSLSRLIPQFNTSKTDIFFPQNVFFPWPSLMTTPSHWRTWRESSPRRGSSSYTPLPPSTLTVTKCYQLYLLDLSLLIVALGPSFTQLYVKTTSLINFNFINGKSASSHIELMAWRISHVTHSRNAGRMILWQDYFKSCFSN